MAWVVQGCATHTTAPTTPRTRALVSFYENGAGILTLVSLPLQYYCQHQKWPQQKELDLDNPLLFYLTNKLLTHQSNQQHIRFKLASPPPGPKLVTNWQVQLAPPVVKDQYYESKMHFCAPKYHIQLPYTFQFQCRQSDHG